MDDEQTITIPVKRLLKWMALGLPAVVLWTIGGMGALALLGGLSNGGVEPGVGSSVESLTIMWGVVGLCALFGIALGMSALFRHVPSRWLVPNVVLSFLSLFFSVLT